MTYEERVKQIAEEMAREHTKRYLNNPDFDTSNNHIRNMWINHMLPVARIAVKHMAEEFTRIYVAIHFSGGNDVADTPYDYIKELAIQQGLIPAQEGGQDETA